MGNNYKHLGKDGAWYNTFEEKSAADARYKQQERQNKLIEQQTRNMEQQNRLIEQQNQLNYQLEREQIQKNYELEMNKLQHEEKMRILRLFDDVGISKETYDTYVNTKFINETTNELLKQRDEHLLMSRKYDDLLQYEVLDKDVIIGIVENDDVYDKNIKDKIFEGCYDKVSLAKQKEKEELIVKYKKAENMCGIILTPTIIFFFIIFLCICCGIWSWIYLLVLPGFAVGLVIYNTVIKPIDIKLDSIPELKFDSSKCINNINNLITKEQSEIVKITQKLKCNNEKQLNALYNFRLNHYNASIEKLLIDVGFKDLVESLGLEYKKVNNSNKKKDGTIEEYIEYFETNL